MGGHDPEPECRINLNGDVQESAFHRFSSPIQIKDRIIFRVSLDNPEPTQQGQMPIWVCASDVFGESEFESSFFEPVLKLLELVDWPHFSDTEDIRMNFPDDADQWGL